MRTFVIAGLAAAVASAAFGFAAIAQPQQLPPGSWRDTCGEARVSFQNGSRYLSARCSKRGGGSEYSSLRLDQCRGDIANDNGRLVCRVQGPPPSASLPDGSYRQSCRDAYVSNGRLYAECRDRRGYWQRSSIDLAACRGRDIANIDGRLTCTGGGGGGGQLPPGSWRQSCDQAYMSGYTLVATCRDNRGQRQRSSLDTRSCGRNEIVNYNGRLTCSGGGGGGGGGGSITLCTQPNFGGRCETIYRDAPGLGPWEIANRSESARVSGRWLVCSEQDFRGRCTTLTGDVRDLNRIGFSRRISSVRRTR